MQLGVYYQCGIAFIDTYLLSKPYAWPISSTRQAHNVTPLVGVDVIRESAAVIGLHHLKWPTGRLVKCRLTIDITRRKIIEEIFRCHVVCGPLVGDLTDENSR